MINMQNDGSLFRHRCLFDGMIDVIIWQETCDLGLGLTTTCIHVRILQVCKVMSNSQCCKYLSKLMFANLKYFKIHF